MNKENCRSLSWKQQASTHLFIRAEPKQSKYACITLQVVFGHAYGWTFYMAFCWGRTGFLSVCMNKLLFLAAAVWLVRTSWPTEIKTSYQLTWRDGKRSRTTAILHNIDWNNQAWGGGSETSSTTIKWYSAGVLPHYRTQKRLWERQQKYCKNGNDTDIGRWYYT